MERIKYKQLWPRYIADMYALKMDFPEAWKELEFGNISVTKTAIPFVSIGADHACEHLNKFMKVYSGLIGISNIANARQHFFLASLFLFFPKSAKTEVKKFQPTKIEKYPCLCCLTFYLFAVHYFKDICELAVLLGCFPLSDSIFFHPLCDDWAAKKSTPHN